MRYGFYVKLLAAFMITACSQAPRATASGGLRISGTVPPFLQTRLRFDPLLRYFLLLNEGNDRYFFVLNGQRLGKKEIDSLREEIISLDDFAKGGKEIFVLTISAP